MGLDVDHPLGRGANRGRQWPGGVMVYAIHPSLGTLKWSFKAVYFYPSRTSQDQPDFHINPY